MSYEGYERWLCSNGHLHEFDCYNTPDRVKWACSECGHPLAWSESVDQTNDGGLPSRLKIDKPDKYVVCEHCRVSRCVQARTYVIPKPKKRAKPAQQGE